MLHTTKWEPDTCTCVIYFTWDDLEPEETRALTATDQCTACTLHTGSANPAELFQAVLQHNRDNQSPH